MADEDRAPPYALEAPPDGGALPEEPAEIELTPAARALYTRLAAEPWAFDFFQALRRIEAVNPKSARLGHSVRLNDPIRLGQVPEVIFSPSTLAKFEWTEDGAPPRLSAYFFGMFGPSGALPLHLTEYARDRIRNFDDPTFARFLDLFHHRFLTFFYRAWASSRPAVSFDRPEQDRFGVQVGSVFGIGAPSLRDRDDMSDHAKLHFSGRLSLQTRNAEGLRRILQDYFKLPVAIDEFMPEWVFLPRQSLCMLGITPDTGTLGTTATIGERIEVYHLKFRIIVGPLTREEYIRLLPDGVSLGRLSPIVRNYLGDELSWDVNLQLLRHEVPSTRLGVEGRLGWTSWIGTRTKSKDADDLILTPVLSAA